MLDELPRIVIVGQAENVAEAINGILKERQKLGS
jgi:hypothetical protein